MDVAVFLGRRAYTDENCLTGADGFAGVRGVRNLAGFADGFENRVQVMLVNGHLARLEVRDALGVDVGADDLVSSFGEASTGYQAHVATTNYREIQGVLLENFAGDPGAGDLGGLRNDYCDGIGGGGKAWSERSGGGCIARCDISSQER